MTAPTRRQILMMAEEAGVTDPVAAESLVRLALAAFRPAPQPVPVTERLPGPDDLGGFDSNCCWWGHWQDGRWIWVWDCEPVRNETHWLPANTPILPAGAIRQS